MGVVCWASALGVGCLGVGSWGRLVWRRLLGSRRLSGLLSNRRGLDLLVVGQGRRPDLGQTAARRTLARPHWCFLYRRRRRLAGPRTFIFLANILLPIFDLLDLPSLASGPRDDLVASSATTWGSPQKRLAAPAVRLCPRPDRLRQQQQVPPAETRQAPRADPKGATQNLVVHWEVVAPFQRNGRAARSGLDEHPGHDLLHTSARPSVVPKRRSSVSARPPPPIVAPTLYAASVIRQHLTASVKFRGSRRRAAATLRW